MLSIEDNAEPMLALAAALYQENDGDQDALSLARTALQQDPNYVLADHQKQQLWGRKLRLATQALLQETSLRDAVDRAEANADPGGSP